MRLSAWLRSEKGIYPAVSGGRVTSLDSGWNVKGWMTHQGPPTNSINQGPKSSPRQGPRAVLFCPPPSCVPTRRTAGAQIRDTLGPALSTQTHQATWCPANQPLGRLASAWLLLPSPRALPRLWPRPERPGHPRPRPPTCVRVLRAPPGTGRTEGPSCLAG